MSRFSVKLDESGQLEILRREVGTRMISVSLDYQRPTDLTTISKAIKLQVEEVLARSKVGETKFLREFLTAQGVCDWVRTHVLFNQALSWGKNGQYRYPKSTLAKYWTSKTLLEQPTLFAVCAGLTRLTLDLATESGLDCNLVNGYTRQAGNKFAAKRDHSWNVFSFKLANGETAACPVDITQSLMTLERARAAKCVRRTPFCLPLTKLELGVFAWKERATELDGGHPLDVAVDYSRVSLDDWKQYGWDNLAGALEWEMAKESRLATVDREIEN